MSYFEEIVASAKQSISEKLSSPLIAGFLFSWVFWNWKFAVIVFSNNTVTKTFELIEIYSFSDWYAVLLRGLLLPLISALFYIFAYPYPAKYIYGYTLKKQREVDQLKQIINDETPLTIEESQRLRAEYVEYERKNSQQLAELNDEIARLKSSLDKYNKYEKEESKLIESKAKSKELVLTDSQYMLLEIMSNKKLPMQESGLIVDSGLSRVKGEYDIGELLRMKLIDRGYDSYGDPVIDFTHGGRGVLLKKNINS